MYNLHGLYTLLFLTKEGMMMGKYNPKSGLIIRGISEDKILEYDIKAKELSKKLKRSVSRQEYLRLVLEAEDAKPIYELQKELIHETIDRFSAIMEQQIDTFNKYVERNEMLIELMTGIPTDDLREGKEHDSKTHNA